MPKKDPGNAALAAEVGFAFKAHLAQDSLPQALKRRNFVGLIGTTEVVPFPNLSAPHLLAFPLLLPNLSASQTLNLPPVSSPGYSLRVGHPVAWLYAIRGLCVSVLFTATLWAQDKPAPSSKPPAQAKSSLPDPGAINDSVYRNSAFGFSYKLPFGWVDRTAGMQDDSADASKSRVLLAVFERPPEATGDTINSAVVIAAEPLLAGIKSRGRIFPIAERSYHGQRLPGRRRASRVFGGSHEAGTR